MEWTSWWPWIIGLGWLVGYEIFSLVTRIPGYPYKRLPTLSQLVWWAYDRAPWLKAAVAWLMAILYSHFFIFRKRNPPDAPGS